MTRSIIRLPAEVQDDDFEVYVNGVPQYADVDYYIDGHEIIFDRALRKDRVSRRRWLLGAWGIGTYRQDDTVDIRYHVDGQTRLKHAAPITLDDESDEP